MLVIDEKKEMIYSDKGKFSISSPEAFNIISRLWLRSCWDMKYIYSFTWLGRPIIQLPEDMFRIQEVIYQVKPDVIIETGIAHGGSSVFYASLCKAMGKGRVISIDVEIRPHNLKAIQEHELYDFITLIEGSSIAPNIVSLVKLLVKPEQKCIVLLDSNHTKDHVLAELNAYSRFVSVGSYIVAMDGWKEWLAGAPRTEADWTWNNPKSATEEFVQAHSDFIIVEPEFAFNEGQVKQRVTACPGAFIQRVK